MVRSLVVLPIVGACVGLLTLLAPSPATAQRLAGRVLEEGRNVPVPGAIVSLVDSAGTHVLEARADSLGRFWLTPPAAGDYVVEAMRFGYQNARTPLLALDTAGSVPVDLTMRPEPIGLGGLTVSVQRQAEDLLRNIGHTPDDLGNRWITHDDIEKMPLSPGPTEVIRRRNIAGIWLDEGITPATQTLCLKWRRAGDSTCALILLNGVEISDADAQAINPLDLEAIAILTPTDATTFYGERAVAGVILLWTRRGGNR